MRNKYGRLRTTTVIVEGDNGTFLGTSRRYDHTLWGFPGGKTDENELTTTCACRELFEETGLIALDVDLIDVRDYDNKTVNPVSHDEVWLYKVLSYKGNLHSNEELVARGEGIVKWITAEELLTGTFKDYNEQILREFYNYGRNN